MIGIFLCVCDSGHNEHDTGTCRISAHVNHWTANNAHSILTDETTPDCVKIALRDSGCGTELWREPMFGCQFALWSGCASPRCNLSDKLLARLKQRWCAVVFSALIPHPCLHRSDRETTRLETRHDQHCRSAHRTAIPALRCCSVKRLRSQWDCLEFLEREIESTKIYTVKKNSTSGSRWSLGKSHCILSVLIDAPSCLTRALLGLVRTLPSAGGGPYRPPPSISETNRRRGKIQTAMERSGRDLSDKV